MNINRLYKGYVLGNVSEKRFLNEARKSFPNIITRVNNFKDSVKILKNKGILTEEAVKSDSDLMKYVKAFKENVGKESRISLDELDYGINCELFEMGINYPFEKITQEQYATAKDKALANLEKDDHYYTSLKAEATNMILPDSLKNQPLGTPAQTEYTGIKSAKADNQMTSIKLQEAIKYHLTKTINETFVKVINESLDDANVQYLEDTLDMEAHNKFYEGAKSIVSGLRTQGMEDSDIVDFLKHMCGKAIVKYDADKLGSVDSMQKIKTAIQKVKEYGKVTKQYIEEVEGMTAGERNKFRLALERLGLIHEEEGK